MGACTWCRASSTPTSNETICALTSNRPAHGGFIPYRDDGGDERALPSYRHDSTALCVRAEEVRICLISSVHRTNFQRHTRTTRTRHDGPPPTKASPNQHQVRAQASHHPWRREEPHLSALRARRHPSAARPRRLHQRMAQCAPSVTFAVARRRELVRRQIGYSSLAARTR
jgi:hypothetical protein